MSHSNYSIDDLVRTAEHQNNSLALEIYDAGIKAVDDDDSEDQITEILAETAQHFADIIDEKLTAYIRDYYYNPESDYFDYLFDMPIEREQLKQLDTDLDIDVIEDRLACMLDYYCQVEISHNYSASNGISVAGSCIGEIEESIEFITDDIPELYSDKEVQAQFHKAVLLAITAVYVHEDSEFIYIDMSSDFASLVINEANLEELLAPEED